MTVAQEAAPQAFASRHYYWFSVLTFRTSWGPRAGGLDAAIGAAKARVHELLIEVEGRVHTLRGNSVVLNASVAMHRLAIFDFDHSLIDDNSDTLVVSGALPMLLKTNPKLQMFLKTKPA